MPETLADYLARQDQEERERKARTAATGVSITNINPDQAAASLRLMQEFSQVNDSAGKLPRSFVEQYKPKLEQVIREKKATTILSNAPKLADWLAASEDNTAVAADDLEGLSWFEGFGRGLWNTGKRAVQRADLMLNQAALEKTAGRARDRKLTLGQLIDDERFAVKGKSGTEYKGAIKPTDVFAGLGRWIDAKYADLIGTDDEANAQDYAARVAQARAALAATPKSEIATKFEREAMADGASLGETLSNFGRAIANNPIGALSWSLETAGESAPTLIAGATATAVTRNPAAGVAVLGAGSYATERYTSPAEFFQEKGLDLSNRDDVARLIADPVLMQEAKDRGVIRGAVIGAFDAASGGLAGKALAKNPLVEALVQGVAQAATGSAGEYAARVAAGQKLDWNEIVAEGVAEMATTPVDMGIAGRKFVRDRDAAKAAEVKAGEIEALSSSAQASALRARLPDSFREYLDQALADGPVENVYVPAQDFVQYFQDQGIDPWELMDDFDGVSRDDLDAALAGGGDLQIPTATYAAKIAGSEADPFFMENMRFSPDAMTAREAMEFNERAQDAMQEAWEEAERMRVEEEALRGVEETIYVEMQSRLRQAGRTTDVANTEAMLYPAFYRVMAERSGLTTEEFLARYPLPRVEGVRPEGMQTKDVTAFTRTLAEARMPRAKVKQGQSLLEFIAARGGIDDPGGELRARDAQIVKRGAGKKNLVLERGARERVKSRGGVKSKEVRVEDMSAQGSMMGDAAGGKYGIDDVAQAAIEAGFMADNPDVLAYKEAMRSGGEVPDITRALWDAIDAELRGEAQYSADVQDDGSADTNEALDQIEEYLASLGVSLDNSDEEILAAVRQDEEGRRYGQGEALPETIDVDGVVRPTTNSEGQPLASTEAGVRAFWNWFGDSKVVDAQGRPLVVYHGTNQPIDQFSADRLGMSTRSESANYGFFFTSDPYVAGLYANSAASKIAPNIDEFERASEELQRKVERLEKQAIRTGDWDAYEAAMLEWETLEIDTMRTDDSGQNIVPAYLAISDPVEIDFGGEGILKLNGGFGAAIKDARDNGRGGLFLKDIDDTPGETRVSDHYVAFSPTQIKSINNRGTFDPNDARILYQPAYHGSPHLFDKFSTSAIGTGEGAQAFGWGLYFAGRREIAEHYRNTLTIDVGFDYAGKTGLNRAEVQNLVNMKYGGRYLDNVARASGVADKVMDDLIYGGKNNYKEGSERRAVYDEIAAELKRPENTGRLYEVEIPDDDEYLLWDKPLSEQHGDVWDRVIDAVQRGMGDPMGEELAAMFELGDATGEEVYRWIATTFEKGLVPNGLSRGMSLSHGPSARMASEILHDAGIAGIKYLDGGSRTADGEVSFNYVVFDDSRVSITRYEQNTGNGPRGSVQFPMAGVGNGDTIIRLSERADLSTFLHESGHYFLTVMQDMAARGEQSAAAEYAAIKGWWRENAEAVAGDARKAFPDLAITADHVRAAIDNGTSGDAAIDAALDVGMQEQWARAFEQYAMEGKAPSAELRSAFERFRAWLLSIYRKLTGLNVNVSDDLRRVFDRMLATDEEIANAQADAGDGGPLFATAEEMGLTPDEFDRFSKLRLQAEEEAKARLLAETMAPIRREREKWYREEREAVRQQVEAEINARPEYRAIEWLGNRRWLGEGQPEAMPDMRLSKTVLVERYGAGITKTLPRGKYPVYAVEGGFDPDEVAGWFGFDSGDAMISAMERAQPRKQAIDAETDKRMYDAHGDVLNDGSVQEEALAAIHGEKRARVLALELDALNRKIGNDQPTRARQVREIARRTINRMKVRDAMNAKRFLTAERKAAAAAYRAVAEGNIEEAAAQKYRQLLNHSLYSEARAVEEEVGKAERFVAKLNKSSKREKIAGAGRRENAQIDYLAAIDEILDRYDFRRMSGRAEDRRGSLVAFVEAMKAAGRERELAIPEAVLSEAARVPYKTLPVETLRGVIDSLRNLEHVALRWNDLIDAQQRREFEATVGDLIGEFEANVERRPPGRVGTTGERLRNAGRQFIDLVLNATTILREIDGFRDQGGAYLALKAPIDAAMNRLTIRKRQAAIDLEALYDVYSRDERRAMAVRKFVPELGYSLSKWEMIAVALNTGNEGNYQRLTDPRVRGSLSEDQVQAVLANLDERDAKFVQSVWDYLETFRPDIAARERRATGVEPEWVEAKPVTIAGRDLKGGYYPLRYDPRLSSLARDDAENDIAQAMQAGRFGKAQTKNGHLQARAQSSGRDVMLDMSVLHRHVNTVIYDLELSEPVANAWRVLQAAPVRDQFIQTGKQADFDALETWLKDVAEGQVGSADWMGSAARTLKSNFTASKLAFNLGTVAVQVTGLSQTMVVVGKRDFLRGLQASFRPGIRDEIAAKSAFMAERQTTFNKDITDYYDDPKLGPTASRWGDFKRDIMGPASFWLMTKVQWLTVDVPTWLAGYEQGLRKFGGDEAQAIAYADGIVKRAQASGLFSDRSAIERGSVSRNTRQNDVIRLFTTLGSYMFAKFNVAYERTAVASREISREGLSVRAAQEALSWSLDMAFLFALEAVVVAAIKGGLPDDEDEDDDGWLEFLAKETAFSVMGTLPFIRDAASSLKGFDGGGAYGSAIDTMVKAGKGAYNILTAPFVEDGEVKRTDVKAVINGTGLATGLPSTQINRGVDAAWRQAEGEEVSPAEYLLGKSPK